MDNWTSKMVEIYILAQLRLHSLNGSAGRPEAIFRVAQKAFIRKYLGLSQ